ncbi:hypothetical protein FEZ48_02230 [Marinilactibacillus psychrotolerans]|uniref:Gamma-glutamyltranspeptidase n=1 Tax=Marinilactibacillus psychrotolerans TaxID=191770 RepID=A0A5R9C7F9_9LACT|nr:hypothetical protein FEZ48_02230 [Marinilactibacillus psychrotolerans]
MIIADDEGPLMGIGSPGGERIPNSLTQVITDWVASDRDLQDIIDTPRFHLIDDNLIIEGSLESEQQNELLEIGYNVTNEAYPSISFGSIQVLTIDRENNELSGVADQRREGDWRVETRD